MIQQLSGKKILLGVCGGVAAYKAAFLVRSLKEQGALVRVVMTQHAKEFISPLLLQALSGHAVADDLFDAHAELSMGHIELANWADYCIVAPASANILAKFSHGIADDLLSTLYLVLRCPIFVCPAMNVRMWTHLATIENVSRLRARQVLIIGPNEGSQACGDVGFGRLAEANEIIDALLFHEIFALLNGHRVVVTAGPTQEAIDQVRFISNHSSGKMGYALANACAFAGAEVVLISGPSPLTPSAQVKYYPVTTAVEMYNTVMDVLQPGDIFIGAAAVGDFRVLEPSKSKIKKQADEGMTLHLVQNPDIISAVTQSKRAQYVVGFAAETDNLLENARKKRITKDLNMMIANQVGEGLGFHVDENEVTLITQNDLYHLPFAHKTAIAVEIVKKMALEVKQENKRI